jgi:hypothetical protein
VEPGRMNAAELQRGIMQAHREFYSWREGIRHLFLPGSQQRFFNCMIRFAGKHLTKKICKSAKPHLKALEGLEQWKEDFQRQCAGLRDRLVARAESLSGDISLRKEEWLRALDQSIERLGESLSALKEEYHPHCRQLIESLRNNLLRETEAILVRVPAT